MNLVDLHCANYGTLEDCSVKQMNTVGLDSKSILNDVSSSFRNN